MALTSLATLLARMQRNQSISQVAQNLLVQDLDDSLREVKRNTNLPSLMIPGTIRVFPDVLLYPVPEDYDYFGYLDTNNDLVPYGFRMRANYTSLQQFYEDPDYRNRVADFFFNNTKVLGIRDKNVPPGFLGASMLLDDAASISNYTATQDASNLVQDNVLFTGLANSSVRFTNTPTFLNQATVSWTFGPTGYADYKRTYFFVSVFLSGSPTSITMKFGNDASDYLTATVTKQFSGQPFQLDNWNTLAFDLNTAAVVGTINDAAFQYASVTLNGAPAGLYNIDSSFLRGWTLLNLFYYSNFVVQTDLSPRADQQYFQTSPGVYSLDSSLIGPEEWADVVMYKALLNTLADKENDRVYAFFNQKYMVAKKALDDIYPTSHPLITTEQYREQTDFTSGGDLWSSTGNW